VNVTAEITFPPLARLAKTDHMTRALVAAFHTAHRARSSALGELREHLADMSNLDEADCGAIETALLDSADVDASTINDDELVFRIRDVLIPMAHRQAQRKREEASRLKKERVRSQSTNALHKFRKRRIVTLFGSETVTSSVGAFLAGPPALVTRAMVAIQHLLLETTESRIVRCDDTVKAETWAIAERVITFFAPWWDSLYSNLTHFRSMVVRAEGQMKGTTDVFLFDDLARLPKNMDSFKGTIPADHLPRAVRSFVQLDAMARSRGAVLVAGFKHREGETYCAKEMTAFTEKCRKYDLFEEEGLLYATDGFGTNHLIVEPVESCKDTTSLSDS
jgi:hypothetical protein